MKIKAVISTILALTLCLMLLPVPALAGTMGDVDASGKVDATDARLALRAAVGLDILTEEAKAAADVDFDGNVSATDARLILRAAVGLEELKEPEKPTEPEETTKPEEDTTAPEETTKPEEDTTAPEETTKPEEDTTAPEETTKPEEDTTAPEETTKPEEPEEHTHNFSTISVTGATKCSVAGCEVQLPSFNDLVNGLKSTENGVNYFTGIYQDISHSDEPVLGGTLAGMMGEEDMAAVTETDYSHLALNRFLTKNSFHAKGADFVSALTDKDVKSIKIEKAETVDFVSALPEKFNVGKTEYDISAIKGYSFPEVYKITVVLPSETADITKTVSGASVYDKIYMADYNLMLESMRKEFSSGFDSLSQEMAGLENMLKMKSSGTITTSLVVEYFVTTDNFTPVAAKYGHIIDVSFDIKITDAVGLVKYLTMLQKMQMTSNSFYFFNNDFGMAG